MSGMFDVNGIMAETLSQSVPSVRPSDEKEKSEPDEPLEKEPEDKTEDESVFEQPTTRKYDTSEIGETGAEVDHNFERPKKTSRQSVVSSSKKSKSDYVQIRNFPRELMSAVRSEFPNAGSNVDALAAYILLKTNSDSGCVSDEVKELVSSYDGNKVAENTEKRLEHLEKQSRETLSLLKELELVMSYIAFDRLGFRRDNPKDMRSIDFLENGVTDVIDRLREQANQFKKQENIKNGRPIR